VIILCRGYPATAPERNSDINRDKFELNIASASAMRWHPSSASSSSAGIADDIFRLIPLNERQHSARCWKPSFAAADCPITRSAVPPSAYGTNSSNFEDRPNSACKALGIIGPSRSVIKMCDDGPCSRHRQSQGAYLVTLHRADTRRAVLRPADV
jgi:hypothetical protein